MIPTVLLSRAPRGARPAPAGRAFAVAACVAALLAFVPGAPLRAQGPGGSGVRVANRAFLSYVDDAGGGRADSADAYVFLRQVAAVALTPSRDVMVTAGQRLVLAHRLENLGNGPDQFRLDLAPPAGWTAGLFVDVDGDGLLGPADVPLAGPVALAPGAAANVLIVLDCPAAAPAATVTLTLRATSAADAAVSATVTDRVLVSLAAVDVYALALDKTASRAAAGAGDTVAYTLAFANLGRIASAAATLADTLPAGLAYVPGSLRRDGAALTDAADADAGDAAGAVIRVLLGAIAPGASGAVTFRAVAAAAGVVTNVAHLSTADTTVAATAATAVELPTLTASKTLVGRDTVRVGEDVMFRIGYANTSTVAVAQSVEVIDTLPAGLVYVSASPAAQVIGQVVTWTVGDVLPGQTGEVTVVARAAREAAGGAAIYNTAVVRGSNAATATGVSVAMRVRAFAGNELAIAKTAAALEAELGDVVPYAITLTNESPAPLRDVVVHDRLEGGTSFARTGLAGADSVRVRGQDVTFYAAGPIAPGASLQIKYAASVVEPGRRAALANRAWADAEGGLVRTDTAVAWVRVRRGMAMRARTAIGKVYVDRNDDGEQQPGEPGAANMRIWTADGQVVTTDAEGRFSFRDLTAGTHAFRLDTVGAPSRTRLPDAEEGMRLVHFDGWTARRVTFRLVPAAPLCDGGTDDPMARPTPSTLAVSALVPGASAAKPSLDRPAAADAAVATVPALRGEAERANDERLAIVEGPAVRVAAPGDGAVVSSNRIYVRVAGEANMPVRLFVDDSLVREERLRPDGTADFVAVEVPPGTHRVRTWMKSSWNRERWDSVAVHRAGAAARFAGLPAATTLHADAPELTTARVRVLDQWGVPVASAPVTVEAAGATVAGADADPSALGTQLRANGAGWLEIPLRAGHDVGPGRVVLLAGKTADTIPLRVLPSVRPLIVSGVGQVGVGAAPDAFAAVSARGAVAGDVTVSVSYDSRRRDQGQFFDRGYDPLDQAAHPTVGDGSTRQVIAASAKQLSARVERGYDWLEVGDVQTADAGAGEGRLGDYRRALTGVSARVGTGALTWQGFGSVTRQALEHRQLRGDGSSGPYLVGGGVRPGTDRVAIEVRALDNAARVISREELVRFTDYQIDYATGTVLLRRPVPSADPYGNPVFVVAAVERLGSGDAHLVGGLRMEADARRWLGLASFDSLAVGAVRVHDAGAGSAAAAVTGGAIGYEMSGADVTVRRHGVTLEGELLRAATGDSAGVAGRASAAMRLTRAAQVELQWLRVGSGFASPSDSRLTSALDEIRVGGEWRISDVARFRVRHERQHFEQYDVERRTTSAGAEQSLFGRRVTQELAVATDARAGAEATSLTAKAGAALTERVNVWTEGVKALSRTAGAGARPDQVGAGASVRLARTLRAELSHRWARLDPDSQAVQLTSATLRTDGFFGGQAWGGVERAGSQRAQHAAVLGWSDRLSIGHGWSATANLERRFGLDGAPLAEPARALPFAQAERDRWSLSGALEWLPAADLARASLRGELHDGVLRQGSRLQLAADASLGTTAALLTLHDWSQDRRPTLLGGTSALARSDRSLLGVAVRPPDQDVLNGLLRVEWRRTVDPLAGGALARAGEDSRLVGATELVWAPSAHTEVTGRYAARWSATRLAAGDPTVAFDAHYTGLRAERRVARRLAAVGDARLLVEGASGASSWSAAPALVAFLNQHLEAEAGWRFGPLQDPDFAAVGGRGFYATLGVRLTEDALASPAAFWRERIKGR
ncbi:MAG: hypothetical protein ACJ8AO_19780 [Gemmatimonadaceae bacterium]